jgi:tetratricopeptide (TPR) repeat protein
MRKSSQKLRVRCAAAALAAAMLLTACAGGAASFDKQMELGRKYLSETNYAEAIAAFTEAIRLNPNDIEAYIGRAQAYTALKKYDEANADYTAVIEMTEEQPYQQASAYVGRAGVGEETGRLADAESDYTAALALLGEKNLDAMDDSDAEAARDLKKETLVKHAAVCVTLVLLDKAAEDYDQLEELGQNVAAGRSELEKLLESTTAAADAENGLPDAETPDQPETPAAEEQPAESKKEEAASSREQSAESKKEEAASSKEQPAESKKEETASSKEQPAESKKEEAASSKTQPVEQKQSYTATKTVPYGNDTQSSSYTTTEKVEYQIGGTTIRLTQQYTNTTEDHVSNEKYVTSETTTDVYTLSQPLQAMERKGDWQVVWDVPAGTVVTLKGTLTGTDSGPLGTDKYSDSRSGVYGIIVSRVLSNDEVDSSAGSYPSFYGESVTIEKGKLYQLTDANEGGTFNEKGGFVFRGV